MIYNLSTTLHLAERTGIPIQRRGGTRFKISRYMQIKTFFFFAMQY